MKNLKKCKLKNQYKNIMIKANIKNFMKTKNIKINLQLKSNQLKNKNNQIKDNWEMKPLYLQDSSSHTAKIN